MKTYVITRTHYPSTFEPVCVVQGRTSNDAHDAAWAACRYISGSPSWSDTEWTEIAVHGENAAGEPVVLFMGSVLELAENLPVGEYWNCTNPRDTQARPQFWRVWIDEDGVTRAGHRHI